MAVWPADLNNFAFRIDRSRPLRSSTLEAAIRPPDLVATYDLTQCTAGQESILGRASRSPRR